MIPKTELNSADDDKGAKIALLFALAAERTAHFYEHGSFAKDSQYGSLASSWLHRSKRTLSSQNIKHLVALSDQVASQITGTLSREAGLFVSHELQQALDPSFQSEPAIAIMAECERVYFSNE
ncbi:MAG: hypothetical protein RIR18_1625 [Pseudomonadota bacterium]